MAFLELLFPEDDSVGKILRRIAKIAEKTETPAFLVGGVIRDRILGRENKDIDITVIGDGIEFAKAVAKSFRLKRVVEYPKFGTAMIPYQEFDIEVATARTETYEENSRKPSVRKGTLEDDLARRDFTINALAMSLNPDSLFELYDYYEGLRDLDSGIIRTPLNPVTTFSEDPLRMMRAVRFAAQLGFKIEEKTFTSIDEVKSRIEIISHERVRDEFIKIMMTPKPSVGINLLDKCGLLEIVFPEIYNLKGVDQRSQYHHKDVYRHTLQVLDNVARESASLELRFTALMHDIAKPRTKRFVDGKGWTFYGHEELGPRMIESFCQRMKLPNKMRDYAMKLTQLHLRPIAIADEGVTDSAVRRLIVSAEDDLPDLMLLCRADITSKNPKRVREYMANFDRVDELVVEVQERDRMRAFQSPVRGDEIMTFCELTPGPMIGYIKTAIEEAILQGIIANDYDEAKTYLETNKKRLKEEAQAFLQSK